MTEARKARVLLGGLAQLGLALLLASALLAGAVALGRHLGVRGQPVIFATIDCDPPEGMTRQQFLDEAQYLSGLPARLTASDALPRLYQALARHPWVSRVWSVRLLPGGRVRAELEYRRPVLAIAQPEREVDGEGVLLPRSGRRRGLPLLTTKVMPPAGKPGAAWGDVRVEATAQVVALLQSRLRLADGSVGGVSSPHPWIVEIDEGEVTLRTPRCRVLWGRPPGYEKAGEASAGEKLRRLPDTAALAGLECDVRPAAGTKQRPLAP